MTELRVVVTGGAGFIGANAVRSLLAAGVHDITILDDLSTGSHSNLDGLDVRFVEGSIEDAPLVHDVIDTADAVVHLAAQGSVALSVDQPLLSHRVNVTGTVNVLEAARPNGHRAHGAQVLLASSAAVYGTSAVLPKHEAMAPDPISPYAATKIAVENYALAYQHTYGVPVLVFRFFNVFGPFQPADHAYAPVIPAFIERARRDMALHVHGDGTQTRDFIYVGTVADVLVEALRRRVVAPHPVNVASGVSRSLNQVIEDLQELVGEPIRTEYGPPRQGDIPTSAAAVAHLHRLFPELEPTAFRDGLANTLAWWT